MIVVSDTTPLISLMKIDRLELLGDLFQNVQIPQAVFDELTSSEEYRQEAEIIRNSSILHVEEIADRQAVERMQTEMALDLGESEAIVLTQKMNADLLLVDERAARSVAKSLGIQITGTIGMLIEAFDSKLLTADDIVICVEGLRRNNRHISEKYLQKILDMTKHKT